MSQDLVMRVFNAAVLLAFKLAAPALVGSMAIGLIIAILQAATQVHEQTLTFAPKVAVIGLVLLAMGPWMINSVLDFMTWIFEIMASTTL